MAKTLERLAQRWSGRFSGTKLRRRSERQRKLPKAARSDDDMACATDGQSARSGAREHPRLGQGVQHLPRRPGTGGDVAAQNSAARLIPINAAVCVPVHTRPRSSGADAMSRRDVVLSGPDIGVLKAQGCGP